MRAALAQINTTVGDVWGNVEKMKGALGRAVDAGADLVAFPELTVTGYPPEDLLMRPSFIQENLEGLAEFARAVPEGVACAAGFVDLNGDLFNACAVVSGGEVLHRYHKRYLPNYGVFDENRYFREGSGSAMLDLGGSLVGVSVCEDIWYPWRPGPRAGPGGRERAAQRLRLPLPPAEGRLQGEDARRAGLGLRVLRGLLQPRRRPGRARLRRPLGGLRPGGPPRGQGEALRGGPAGRGPPSFESLIQRLHDPRPRKENPEHDPEVVRIPSPAPRAARAAAEARVEPYPPEEGEVLEALVLGLRDYFRKNGFSRAVLGLSGGIDSSLAAAVAVRALGPENVTGVLMPSRYTSDLSNTDAAALAKNLGVDTQTIPIGPAFDAYGEMLAGAFKGLPEDVTEENLQSRIRGNILMALSNKFGWIVLSTGNKSEMSVGYSTLYGDSAGGFAVIKDVPKNLVYRVSREVNRVEGREVIPESVLDKEPSAELRETSATPTPCRPTRSSTPSSRPTSRRTRA
jgi:NAD+ synthase (glutamine-hydrolysing)